LSKFQYLRHKAKSTMKLIFSVLSLLLTVGLQAQIVHGFQDNRSFSHQETLAAYDYLQKNYPEAKLQEAGLSDAGLPLHLFIIDKHKNFDPKKTKDRNKRILLINNAIHAGEPCGVDASILFAERLLKNPGDLLDNTVVLIIPMYNVGGAANRGCCSRVNQNGPESHGFRGSSKNLDLNRDFIKCDSENSRSFTTLFHRWDPDVFVDTHTSNGADYQYTMTLISTAKEKMHALLGSLTERDLIPFLYREMAAGGYEMIPYVDTVKETPDDGIYDFPASPRYSQGYTNLFSCIGFTSEAHMLKPFSERVLATDLFLQTLLKMTHQYSTIIGDMRQKAKEHTAMTKMFDLNHKLDTTRFELINFKGYETIWGTSPVTDLPQHYYDTGSPYEKPIRYYKNLEPGLTIKIPDYYIIPQCWTDVIELLQLNGVKMQRLKTSVELEVQYSFINDYQTTKKPYEGHYLHSDVKTTEKTLLTNFAEGDYVIKTNQQSNYYIASVLEPKSEDSFFCWNFFDAVLMQKEWFSTYIFDQKAQQMLKDDPNLKARFLIKKKDPAFAADKWAQLYFIYQNSPHYEETHNRYPVARYNGVIQDSWIY
jgi:hypothetical protein